MRGRRQRLGGAVTLAALAVGLLLLAGGATARPGAAPARSSLHFGPCPSDAGVDHTTGCARIRVPLDYSRPGGRKISLEVAAEAAAGSPSQRQGVLFVNPGGPGTSALWLASQVWDSLPSDLQAAYEVVAIDPRGVGHSTPILCRLRHLYAPPLPDLNPSSQAAEQRYVARARATARACGRRYSRNFLAHIDTADMARDMDFVRAALGVKQINYLGYSYGTYLGEVYGQLFPHRVRRMILDSVVDPTISGFSTTFRQDTAFQARLREFFSWVAARQASYHLGASRSAVARSWGQIRSHLAAHPVARRVGPSELSEATLEAMYSTTNWASLAHALSAYERGHTESLQTEGQILSNASNASYLAVSCRDTAWPRNWAVWNRDTRNAFRTAPLTSWDNTWENAPCAFWPVRGKAIHVTGQGVPPVLLLQSRHDPATPMANALDVRRLYGGGSRVVLEAGGNHGQYLFNNNRCMNRYGDAYLLTGSLPAHNASCPSAARYAAAERSLRSP